MLGGALAPLSAPPASATGGLEEGELEQQRWAVWRGCRQRQRLGVAVADG